MARRAKIDIVKEFRGRTHFRVNFKFETILLSYVNQGE